MENEIYNNCIIRIQRLFRKNRVRKSHNQLKNMDLIDTIKKMDYDEYIKYIHSEDIYKTLEKFITNVSSLICCKCVELEIFINIYLIYGYYDDIFTQIDNEQMLHMSKTLKNLAERIVLYIQNMENFNYYKCKYLYNCIFDFNIQLGLYTLQYPLKLSNKCIESKIFSMDKIINEFYDSYIAHNYLHYNDNVDSESHSKICNIQKKCINNIYSVGGPYAITYMKNNLQNKIDFNTLDNNIQELFYQ